ncbi:MAG: FixH family protein [Gillisia sp.]
MKINWGVGVMIALFAFIAFILNFVYLMYTDDKYEYDLVVEEYYKQEVGFQGELNAEKDANSLAENVVITATPDGVLIQFPVEEGILKIDGLITFYRPSGKELDFTRKILIDDREMFISKEFLVEGRWDVNVRWEYDGKNYLTKKKIIF